MNDLSMIQDFFQVGVDSPLSLLTFLMNMVLAAILSHWVGLIYIKYGGTLSNRPAFAKNFILVSITTMLVISIVKSSLALSLGLIGALSIVRFRAAIKEPEELSYIFLVIAIGLGMGAGQQIITVIAIIAILIILWIKNYLDEDISGAKNWDPDLYLTVSAQKKNGLTLDKISELVEENSSKVRLKRADLSGVSIEVLFLVELEFANAPHAVEEALRKIDSDVNVTFLEAV